LLDERCELELRAKHSSFWERNLPAILKLSQLRVDICELKDAVGSLKDDAWVCIYLGVMAVQTLTSLPRPLQLFT